MPVSRTLWFPLLFVLAAGGLSVTPSMTWSQDKPVKVAMIDSIFSGQDRKKVLEQIRPFSEIVQKETGTPAIFDVFSLPEIEVGFAQGDVQLVILTGLEYGWLRDKNDQAKALLVASIDPGATKTLVIAKRDDSATTVQDLLGAKFAAPERLPYLTQFYLKRTLKKPLEEAFQLLRSGNVDDTIEEVIAGKVRAATVTAAGLDAYRDYRGEARTKKLKIVHQSPDFPPATVMYHAKNSEAAALKKFEDALLKAGQNTEGQRVLTLYKLKGFEKVPETHDKAVAEIVKQFPR